MKNKKNYPSVMIRYTLYLELCLNSEALTTQSCTHFIVHNVDSGQITPLEHSNQVSNLPLLKVVSKKEVLRYKTISGRISLSFIHLGNPDCSITPPVFSSPEPKAPGELIGWEGSVVRRPSVHPSVCRPSTISNDFSSETTRPIANKFHIQPPGPLG